MLKIKQNRYTAGWKGACMGLGVTGGWLLCDFMLPEPWGDVLLFSLMAVVNVLFGWKFAMMSEQRELGSPNSHTVNPNTIARSASSTVDTTSTVKYESEM